MKNAFLIQQCSKELSTSKPHFPAHTETGSFMPSLKIHWVPIACKQSPGVGSVLGCGIYIADLCEKYCTVYPDSGVVFNAKEEMGYQGMKDMEAPWMHMIRVRSSSERLTYCRSPPR